MDIVERLEAAGVDARKRWPRQIFDGKFLHELLADAAAEVAALRHALEFYADPTGKGYGAEVTDYGYTLFLGDIIEDAGETARKALEQNGDRTRILEQASEQPGGQFHWDP